MRNDDCRWLLQDEYDDDGDLRPQYRRLSLHSAAASSRALLSAVSARILHAPAHPSSSPPPLGPSGLSEASSSSSAAASATRRARSSVCAVTDARTSAVHHRKYHSFRSALRPANRTRLSFDSGQTARTLPPPHNT